ncbi:sec1 family domain-containing protein 1-like protein [Leptotrombidium deliense]|uniref:Sec1 family domain-containing protein 1-like protein n=1 Tax=Leptotrombidium deliense TaxID=299467 RepID=A0A443STI5_9ACAR|nr:sec1 family domain-containing protein 1-like protein [Leptotrombidium deliense]
MTAVSIREQQKRALKSMLNLNQNPGTNSASEPQWKLLVIDKTAQDIISPLISVKELRDVGVTLHLYLHSERDSIPEVPVVYFVAPTDENIMRICQDLRNHLYDNYYLNFISPVSRAKLEDLATAALQGDAQTCVRKVYDQYLNFISLEDDLFLLKEHDKQSISYYAINRGDVKDAEMDTVMDNICDGLFAFLVTLGVVPIIRSPKGNAAEMVAEKLNKKLKENLQNTRNNLFTPGEFSADSHMKPISFQRPLLVILDRNMDMATPLHHTWTYEALVHDVLDFKLNQVKLEETSDRSVKMKGSGMKSFDLSPNDKFWQQHKGSPFPQVAEAVQEELEAYRASEDEVKRLKAAMGIDGNVSDEGVALLSDNTSKLTSAVSSLPELLEKKRMIDMHTTIATTVLSHIKNRKLDIYFETEEKILSKTVGDKSPMEILNDPESGSIEDKLRLFLLNYICSSTSDDELKKLESCLIDQGCDVNAINYMKRWKTFSKIPLSSGQYSGGTKTVNMFSKLVSSSQFVMEGVKNLVVKKNILPFTRIVDALMEMKSIQEIEDYRYLDPKLFKVSDNNAPRSKTPFQDAIVFVVGGGNYIEYQNLVDYCKNKSMKSTPKRIIYGCTELTNAEDFLKQLSQIG